MAEDVNDVVFFPHQTTKEMDFVTQCVLLLSLSESCKARALLGQCLLREELLLSSLFLSL